MKKLYYITIGIVIAAVIGSIAVFESFSRELEKDNGESQQQLNENKLNSPSNLPENSSKGMDTDQGD